MSRKKLFISLFIFYFCSCNSSLKTNLNESKDHEAGYIVALNFINNYVEYSNDTDSKIHRNDWINNRKDVSINFKKELTRIIKAAEAENPGYGLGFDPIIDAQDNPSKFKIDKKESEYLTVKGINWETFTVILKIQFIDNQWLVDGAGVINIPESKQRKL